jgi:hypothetical protein
MFLRNVGRISTNYTALYLRRKKRNINNIYARYAIAFIICLLILPNLKTLLAFVSTYVVHNIELMLCEFLCGFCTEKQNKVKQSKRLRASSSNLRYVLKASYRKIYASFFKKVLPFSKINSTPVEADGCKTFPREVRAEGARGVSSSPWLHLSQVMTS